MSVLYRVLKKKKNGAMIQGRIESGGQEMDFLNDIEQSNHQC